MSINRKYKTKTNKNLFLFISVGRMILYCTGTAMPTIMYICYIFDGCVSTDSNLNNSVEMTGGILITIRKDCLSCVLPIVDANAEQLFVRFAVRSFCYIICRVYIHNIHLLRYHSFVHDSHMIAVRFCSFTIP